MLCSWKTTPIVLRTRPGLFGDVVSHDESAAAGGDHQGGENAKRSRFAAAVGAEEPEDLGGAYFKRDASQGYAVAVLMT